ncbi:MAG TPA: hypothetical protein VGM10_11265 [Actinocrinis sp.]
MTEPATGRGAGGAKAPWRALFSPEERMGWVFTDRDRHRRRFDEPEPAPDASDASTLSAAEQAVDQKFAARVLKGGGRAFAVGVVVGFAVYLRTAGARHHFSPPAVFVSGIVGGLAVAALWCALVWGHRRAVHGFWSQRRGRHQQAAESQHGAWLERRTQFDEGEYHRVAALSEWTSAQIAPGSRRVDIVGGNLWGWEAFLTVFGASTLAARGPAVVLDLSGEVVVRELVRGAAASGLSVDFQLLPTELAHSDLLAGMGPEQVAEVFVESLYGGDDQAGQASRAERGMTTHILTEVCRALAAGGAAPSMARIAEGMRVLMDEPAREGILSPQERGFLANELFSAEYRRRSFDTLQRIAAVAQSLGPLGGQAGPRAAADLRCVAMSSEWRSGGADFLSDLIVGWAAQRVGAGVPGAAGSVATLVVAGADELAVRHIERLSDLCDRRGVRLVMLFRHLRETSARVIGAGPVGFMKLGNHEEAVRAADYIGREYRFELSRLTHSVGGDETHGTADTTGGARSFTKAEGREKGGSRTEAIKPRTHSWAQSDTRAWTTERSWGQTVSAAQSENWSDSTTQQRVYEHAVEPRTLQQLPDYAMVLVEHAHDGVRVRAVDVNPEIAGMGPGAAGGGFPGRASLPAQAGGQGQAQSDEISVDSFRAPLDERTQYPQLGQAGLQQQDPAFQDRGRPGARRERRPRR